MPVETFTDSGVTILNTDTMEHGVCIGTLTCAPGAWVQKQYPSLVGCTVTAISSTGLAGVSITYPNGVPTVTLAGTGEFTNYATIWAHDVRVVEPAGGLYAVTPTGSIALTPEAHGLNYKAKAIYSHQVGSFGDKQNGGQLGWSVLYLDHPTPPAVALRLEPGQIGHIMGVSPHESIAGRWLIYARVIASSASWPAWEMLITPTVYCYVKKPSASGASEFAIFDESQNLAWDLCIPDLLYPAARATMQFNTTASVPVADAAFAGTVDYVSVIEQSRDEVNEVPEWYVYLQASGGWLRESSSSVRAGALTITSSGYTSEPQSPGEWFGRSDLQVINVQGL